MPTFCSDPGAGQLLKVPNDARVWLSKWGSEPQARLIVQRCASPAAVGDSVWPYNATHSDNTLSQGHDRRWPIARLLKPTETTEMRRRCGWRAEVQRCMMMCRCGGTAPVSEHPAKQTSLKLPPLCSAESNCARHHLPVDIYMDIEVLGLHGSFLLTSVNEQR